MGVARKKPKTKPRRDDAAPPSSKRKPATDASVKISASIGIIAAMVVAVVVNILVSRHYERWDWTKGGLYTLSPATLQTLQSLEEPVDVYVMLSSGDPLQVSMQHLLSAYEAETNRLNIKYVDPDRSAAEFLALQQRFGVVAGRADDGRIVTDAALIVVRGEKPYFVTAADLVHVEDPEDLRTRPRLEQGVTSAIRNVLGDEKPKICFTTGHGEAELNLGGQNGIAELRERLYKNNYEVSEVPPAALTEPAERPLENCHLVVLAGPIEPVPEADVQRLVSFVRGGGNALLVVGPVPNEADRDFMDLGVAPLVALAGVTLREDFVFELRPAMRSAQGHGETFMPALKPHDINASHLDLAEQGLPVALTVASSLEIHKDGPAAIALLETSEEAFGMTDFFGWAQNPTAPNIRAEDHRGPLVVATATELSNQAKSVGPDGKPRGSRIVVVSSNAVLRGANWSQPNLRGTARFMENTITWLASHRVFVDIPSKSTSMTGLQMTEESLNNVFRYVVVYVPSVVMLLGGAVWLRRRRTGRKPASADRGRDDKDREDDEDDEDDQARDDEEDDS